MHLHPNIIELALWVFITNTLHYNKKIMMIVNFIKHSTTNSSEPIYKE